MPTYKDEKTGTWYCKFYYTDYTGTRKQKLKRGFKLQRTAKEWEQDFLTRLQGCPDMTFKTLYELYATDLKEHARESTYRTHLSLVRRHVLPFWEKLRLDQITPADVRRWQGEIKKHGLAPHTQYVANCYLSTIFNFAVRYYNLPSNPCRTVPLIGKPGRSLTFWTLEEYQKFLPTVIDPIMRAAFQVLFYTGMRCGELLALQIKDFDAEKKSINICGTYHRYDRTDIITDPKSDNSKRVITIPDFLVEELQDLLQKIYSPEPTDRIFQPVTSIRLRTAITKGSSATEIKRIRVHDLRHSHVSLLINMGFPALLIAERIGDTVDMVNKIYGHLYPNRHREVADQLEKLHL